jgi:hypothetical protein
LTGGLEGASRRPKEISPPANIDSNTSTPLGNQGIHRCGSNTDSDRRVVDDVPPPRGSLFTEAVHIADWKVCEEDGERYAYPTSPTGKAREESIPEEEYEG